MKNSRHNSNSSGEFFLLSFWREKDVNWCQNVAYFWYDAHYCVVMDSYIKPFSRFTRASLRRTKTLSYFCTYRWVCMLYLNVFALRPINLSACCFFRKLRRITNISNFVAFFFACSVCLTAYDLAFVLLLVVVLTGFTTNTHFSVSNTFADVSDSIWDL